MRSLALLGGLFLVSCTHPAPSETTSRTSEPVTTTGRPVVATFETHDAKISILGGAAGADEPLRVVVRNQEGTILADGITVDELRRTDPLLGALVTTAVAHNGAKSSELKGTYVDATLDLPTSH
jgi:hypothetical protein